ncbi:MAG: glycosyltransferase [Methyloceanibacter sp.]|jgi:alpha-1,6-mannosyltransferase
MRFCDITIAYNRESGGIRTYIDQKRQYLREKTDFEHLLIIPGESDAIERSDRAVTISIGSPLLPGQKTYRFFVRPDKILAVLQEWCPDIVELGSYYLAPWAAWGYRQRLQKTGRDCVIGCYFHTDVADAYVNAPLRSLSKHWVEPHSETLADLANQLAHIAEIGAERYIAAVFGLCDLAIAPSPAQAERLAEYGIPEVEVVPLGVDVGLFNPSRRSQSLRLANGAKPESLVLLYVGRLSNEKRVTLLVEALKRLPQALKPVLWIVGQGPLRDELNDLATRTPSLRVLPYCRDRKELASLMASADIYVTAGPHETFGLSVIEAQASGAPVVGVRAGALIDRVSEGLGYLGPLDDAQAIAENIERAATEREAIGSRARRHVETHFAWDRTFSKLMASYRTKIRGLPMPIPSLSHEASLKG